MRKLSDNGHQASILTTHPTLSTSEIAGKMFSRWSQENFFRYLMQDYSFDHLLQYGTEKLPDNINVVNPAYSQLSYKIKKIREKKARLEAQLLQHIEKKGDMSLETISELIASHSTITEKITEHKAELEILLNEKKNTPARIRIAEMSKEKRYNKLKTESKLFINLIKMIAYRAETALVNLIQPYFQNKNKEGRMLIKSILSSDADLIPDEINQTITVVLHTRASPRMNNAASELCRIMTEQEEVYPGTNPKVILKTHLNQFTKVRRSDFTSSPTSTP